MKMPRMLTVAGSDSGGGAGIQADVRTASLLGCHCSTAITAVTAQNSTGVEGIFPMEPEQVAAQVDAVLCDIGADAVKTGMLFSAEIIRTVSALLAKYDIANLVVDPVMIAKGGAPLLRDDAVEALKSELLPKALLVTPNLPEAEALTGMKATHAEQGVELCRRLLELGPKAVLLKGGHAGGEVVSDILVTQGGVVETFTAPRIDTPHTHGTGCTLAAAITAGLAKGYDLKIAVAQAHGFLHRAIKASYELGKGHGPTNPWAAASGGGDRELLGRLYRAWDILEEANPYGLIPEIQSNLAEALPDATSFEDVAAFPGRLVKCGERIRRVDGPRFGATRHMAKILLASARRHSPFRAVMNISYGQELLDACRETGLSVESFSRYDEPPEVKAAEGSSLEWGTTQVLETTGYFPDAIYDEGDVGKEPVIRVFGVDAVEVAERVAAIWHKVQGEAK